MRSLVLLIWITLSSQSFAQGKVSPRCQVLTDTPASQRVQKLEKLWEETSAHYRDQYLSRRSELAARFASIQRQMDQKNLTVESYHTMRFENAQQSLQIELDMARRLAKTIAELQSDLRLPIERTTRFPTKTHRREMLSYYQNQLYVLMTQQLKLTLSSWEFEVGGMKSIDRSFVAPLEGAELYRQAIDFWNDSQTWNFGPSRTEKYASHYYSVIYREYYSSKRPVKLDIIVE